MKNSLTCSTKKNLLTSKGIKEGKSLGPKKGSSSLLEAAFYLEVYDDLTLFIGMKVLRNHYL